VRRATSDAALDLVEVWSVIDRCSKVAIGGQGRAGWCKHAARPRAALAHLYTLRYSRHRCNRICSAQVAHMTQAVPTSMRLDPDIKAALARAAEADGRSVSNMLDRILRFWLTEHGHMRTPPAPKAGARKKTSEAKP
jgi:hypothetical protein